MSTSTPPDVSFLVLGAGWLSQFLLPLLTSRKITHGATTTTGRDNTIKFVFEPDSSDTSPYHALPNAKTILITFPLKGSVSPTRFIDLYSTTHPNVSPRYILLGSTGVWSGDGWFDRNSPITSPSERVEAEEQLLKMGGTVLNLAGLWGESGRDMKIWERAVPMTKKALGEKSTVHFIHGMDVSRGVLAVAEKEVRKGERWLVSDCRVYDWWDMVWGEEGIARLEGRLGTEERYRKWLLELMQEQGVRALPRERLHGRMLDSREFWRWIGLEPGEGRFKMPVVKEEGASANL